MKRFTSINTLANVGKEDAAITNERKDRAAHPR
jgi:hypothetical protein